MAAVRAAAWRRSGLWPAGLRAFWSGRRYPQNTGCRKEEREVEADQAVPEEERSDPSLICPPPRSRSYFPPEDLQSRLESHVREVFGPSLPEDWQQTPLQENRLKHRLLARLAAELGHAVPNSQLHQMRHAGDVLGFYCTPVKDGTKIDELTASELPPNLKIIWQQ
ncbi:PREDICTED: 39S ribosomal protein L50, mitochondrial isoform X1 [Pseudopodoces humilis]|uniref:39S ribosomal protein L50, mitochondrial isoform X1 n=1 Tax=Pseudopodoces humilis TaxID=181119 RepID=UPI0006B6DCD8|nr:PREDICTED: 39S ribosomal protein L50, mitochondrial isoform X1 [Pseudopodoces humilis]